MSPSLSPRSFYGKMLIKSFCRGYRHFLIYPKSLPSGDHCEPACNNPLCQDSCECRSNAACVGKSRPGSTRSCRSDGGTDPPESACRGRLQTTPERHWLKTVVVSVGGKGASMWSVRCESRRRARANHCRGVKTDKKTSKPGATTTPGTSPSGAC